MNLKLLNLVRQYKQSLDRHLMDEIYQELLPLIKQKSDFIFYQKKYPFSLYYKCKACLDCKIKSKINCEICEKCTCVKGTFNLCKSGLCEYDDVKDDLVCEILRIIKNYNPEKDFETYLYACLWEFKPTFLTKNFIKSLKNKPLTQLNEKGEEVDLEIPVDNNDAPFNLSMEKIMELCNSDIEKEVITLLIDKYNQPQIAKKLNVSKQYISLIVNKLKEKIKKLLVD